MTIDCIICGLLAGLTYLMFRILAEVVHIGKMMEEKSDK